MLKVFRCGFVVLAISLFPLVASAQTPAPSPQALTLAKPLVAKVEPNPQQTIAAMAGPMANMIGQMGVNDPQKAQILVQEAVIPLLNEHIDGLVEASAVSYANTLSLDDLKAILDFYNTPAGQDLIKAQPVLAQQRVQGLGTWIGGMQPEIQTRVVAVAKQHGWQ